MDRTEQKIDTPVTSPRSGPVRYELIDKDGNWVVTLPTARECGIAAKRLWPDQEQDEDRTGKGWDVQAAGCE